MSIARVIEALTEQALADVKVVVHELTRMGTANHIRTEWNGRWMMASLEHGNGSLQCMVINRAMALIDAAISAKVGGQWPAPSPLLIYPQQVAA
jgi:hypothetical protein